MDVEPATADYTDSHAKAMESGRSPNVKKPDLYARLQPNQLEMDWEELRSINKTVRSVNISDNSIRVTVRL